MTSQVIIQAIISGILMGLIYALIAAGLSLIFGLMEIVNFAHGDHLMRQGHHSILVLDVILYWLDAANRLHEKRPGDRLFTHYFIIRKILNSTMLIQICATFGLAVTIRALAQFFFTPDFRTIKNPIIQGKFEVYGVFIGYPQLFASFVCLFAFILLYLFVTKTETGTALQATSQDRQAAEILGIPSNKMFALGWAIGLSCVAVAGSMLSNYYYVFPDVGVNFSLFAFVAVALGGFGSMQWKFRLQE